MTVAICTTEIHPDQVEFHPSHRCDVSKPPEFSCTVLNVLSSESKILVLMHTYVWYMLMALLRSAGKILPPASPVEAPDKACSSDFFLLTGTKTRKPNTGSFFNHETRQFTSGNPKQIGWASKWCPRPFFETVSNPLVSNDWFPH